MIRTADQCAIRAPPTDMLGGCSNTLRVLASQSVGNQKESKMYIGGGIGLVLLIVLIVMLVR